MTTPFPTAKKKRDGYDRHQVDEFLARARRSYDGAAEGGEVITSADLRSASFDLAKNGYSVRFVDAALDRLEDVFFEREKRNAVRQFGPEVFTSALGEQELELRNRLEADRGKRFRRVALLAHGYDRREVDLFLDRVLLYVNKHTPLTAAEVRDVVFSGQLGGYSEDQVDAFLDAVVAYVLASR